MNKIFIATVRGNKQIEARRIKLKQKILNEVVKTIFEKYYRQDIEVGDTIDTDVFDYWDEYGRKEVRRAARLAIELWEKRR